VKTNLFLISGVVEYLGKTAELKKLGGLYPKQPALAILFLIPAMSLAGIPPLSGFFAKFNLIKAGLIESQYWIVGIALIVSLLTLFSMIKLWNEAFWKPALKPATAQEEVLCKPMILPIVLLASLTILIGLGIGPVFDIAMRTGIQLSQPELYVAAVLGGPR
jgi:multicomponent Na+:H+ antiporter subunit D